MNRAAASRRIVGCLRRMGMPAAWKANRIICEAVLACRDNPGQICGAWLSQILPTAAAACGVSRSCAETAISRALKDLWHKHGRKVRAVLRLPEAAEKPGCRDFILLISGAAFDDGEDGV